MGRDVNAPRIAPVDPDSATDAQRELLAGVRVEAGSNLFHTYANHPALMREWMRFGGRLLLRSAFEPRTRELIILRTAVRCDCDYEWGQHVQIARDAGLDDTEIARIAHVDDHDGWIPADAEILEAVDELVRDHTLSETLWTRLAARFDTTQLVELPILVGHYAMLAGLLRSLAVQREGALPGIGDVGPPLR